MSPHSTRYDSGFFDGLADGTRESAREVLPLVFSARRCESVVDVGCGRGAWLSVCVEQGVKDVLGIDGDYVDAGTLLIPAGSFIAADLTRPPRLDRRFDLAMCLEVAEHLPPESAPALVGYLTSLAPVVLFSAAVPRQGGTAHVNEQWPEYWQRLFEANGFAACDCLRPRLWSNEAVSWWYRQNLFIYAAEPEIEPFEQQLASFRWPRRESWPLVHPGFIAGVTEQVREMHQTRRKDRESVTRLSRALARAVWRKLRPERAGRSAPRS